MRYSPSEILAMLAPEKTRVYFQPKVDLATGETCGYEALLRLVDEDGEISGPAEVLHAIGRLHRDLHLDVHRRLLARVLPAAYAVHCETNTFVSVNVTSDVLESAEAVRWLVTQGVHGITIEIVETDAIRDLAAVNKAVARLHHHGFKVAIDDYGKGFSTAALLASLPDIDEVKIDTLFLDNGRARSMLPTMCQTIQAAGAKVTIEGIESMEAHEACIAVGANYGQGYWYGLPQPAPIAAKVFTADAA